MAVGREGSTTTIKNNNKNDTVHHSGRSTHYGIMDPTTEGIIDQLHLDDAVPVLDDRESPPTPPTTLVMEDDHLDGLDEPGEVLAAQDDNNLGNDNDAEGDEEEDEDEEASLCGWIVVDEDARSHVSQLTIMSRSIHRKRRSTRTRRKEASTSKKNGRTKTNSLRDKKDAKESKKKDYTATDKDQPKHDNARDKSKNKERKKGCQHENLEPRQQQLTSATHHVGERTLPIIDIRREELSRSLSDSALNTKQVSLLSHSFRDLIPPPKQARRHSPRQNDGQDPPHSNSLPKTSEPKSNQDPTVIATATDAVPPPTSTISPLEQQQEQQSPTEITTTTTLPKRKKSKIKKSSRHTEKTKPLSSSDFTAKSAHSPTPGEAENQRKSYSKLKKSNKDKLLPLDQEMEKQKGKSKEKQQQQRRRTKSLVTAKTKGVTSSSRPESNPTQDDSPKQRRRTKSLAAAKTTGEASSGHPESRTSTKIDSPKGAQHKSMVIHASSSRQNDDAPPTTIVKPGVECSASASPKSKPRTKKQSGAKASKNSKAVASLLESSTAPVVPTTVMETANDDSRKQEPTEEESYTTSNSTSTLTPLSNKPVDMVHDHWAPQAALMDKHNNNRDTFASAIPQTQKNGMAATLDYSDAPSKKKGKNFGKLLRSKVLKFIIIKRLFRSDTSSSLSSQDNTIHNKDNTGIENKNLESNGQCHHSAQQTLLDSSLHVIREDGGGPELQPPPLRRKPAMMMISRTLSFTGPLLHDKQEVSSTSNKSKSFRISRRPT